MTLVIVSVCMDGGSKGWQYTVMLLRPRYLMLRHPVLLAGMHYIISVTCMLLRHQVMCLFIVLSFQCRASSTSTIIMRMTCYGSAWFEGYTLYGLAIC